MSGYEIYQQTLGGVALAAVGYALVEEIIRRTRWM